MYSVFYTIVLVGLWVVNVFNGTAMGETYRTAEIATAVTLVVAVCCLAVQSVREGDLEIAPKYFYTVGALIVVTLINLYVKGYSLLDIRAYWGFLVVFILSKMRPNKTAVRMTAVCYGVLGLFFLYVYGYTDVLKGWNSNSVAMVGLFSFLVFCIPFYGMREWRSFVMMPLVGAIYVVMILPTDSRSCILMIIIELLLVLRIIPIRKTLSKSKSIIVFLQIPLIIAVFVVLVSIFGNMAGLMQWSYETFNKPLFNGRDELWISGLKVLKSAPLFGTGNMGVSYWHNCAIASLTSTGIVGYVLWIRLLYLILNQGRHYLYDTVVIGGMTSFLVLYAQQSVELGLFAISPNIIPYIILGIVLGRVGYLKEYDEAEKERRLPERRSEHHGHHHHSGV